ncbi:Glycosyltransferase [Indibacter alkaliphilus LW1]|uniref:Glycosyltransferase n=2 Tax=Indibacter TaxID=647744 RepID=S2D9V4_INDAL|nr:Glycosyltransferase [Indibacter alkaliphilus LW1]
MDFGGLERRVLITAIGFQQNPDVELEIFVLGSRGKTSDEISALGIQPKHFNSKIKIPNIKLIYALYRQFKLIRPDVVHTSSAEANFHGLIAAWLAGVPVRIGEEIGFPNHDWKWSLIFKAIYKLATKVIGISKAVKDRIVELGEVSADKVEVVYNPVSVTDSVSIKISVDPDAFIFVSICRLVPVKNLQTLILAFKELMSSELHEHPKLWIVGDGTEREKLEKQVHDLELNDHVIFWGFQMDVSPYLKAAQAFVLPSLSEGFSISLVEAMFCGLPCIVTNQGGPTEIIEDKETGFLIDPHNQDQILDTMRKMLHLPKDHRKTIGFKAQQAAKKYSVSNYINRLLEVYEDCR